MELLQPNYRSSTYYIAQRSVGCPRCGASTRVAALALPINHEACEDGEDGQDSTWATVAACALLFGVSQLPPQAGAHLRRLAPGFRQESAWSNHCEHCNAPIDDHDLHCEPGDSFVPLSETQGAQITLIEIPEPLEVWASGYSLDPLFLPCPQRA